MSSDAGDALTGPGPWTAADQARFEEIAAHVAEVRAEEEQRAGLRLTWWWRA